jgi:hypothetical protein
MRPTSPPQHPPATTREESMKPRLSLPIAVIIVMLGAFALAMALG